MTDPCKHGSLPRSCEICERDVEIERFREQLRLTNIDACNLQVELADANKRIELLEDAARARSER